MPEYAMEDSYSISGYSGSISIAEPALSPRIQQVKILDETLSKLEAQVDALGHQIAPALRPSHPEAVDLEKNPDPNDSDVVTHLRHTIRRVNDVIAVLSGFAQRVDL